MDRPRDLPRLHGRGEDRGYTSAPAGGEARCRGSIHANSRSSTRSRSTSSRRRSSFLEDEVCLLRRRLTNAPRQVKLLEEKLVETRRAARPARCRQNEKLADTLQAERERIEALARGGREAQPAARDVRRLPRHQRRRLGRRVHRGPQDARERLRPTSTTDRARARASQVDPERGPERRRGARARRRRRGRQGQGPARRRPRDRDRPRATRSSSPRSAAALLDVPIRAGDTAAVRPAVQRRAREAAEGRGRGARPRGDPRRQLRGHRRARGTDRGDPRRGRAAVPVRGAVPRAPARGAQGRPALRAPGLRQDADRQGRGQVARRQGARADRAPATRTRTS